MARDRQGERLDLIMGRHLAAGRTAGDAHCPDASIIAAYRERLLSAGERDKYERHFAQCVRCSRALAALARLDDADVAMAPAGAVSAQSVGGDRSAWWRSRRPLPLAAFGAAAAVLIIVVALRTLTAPPAPIDGEAQSELQAKSLAANAAPGVMPPSASAPGGSNSLLAMNEPAPAKPASPPTPSFTANALQPPAEAGLMKQDQARTAPRDEPIERKSRALHLALKRLRLHPKTEAAVSPAAPPSAHELARAESSANAFAAPTASAGRLVTPETSTDAIAAAAPAGAPGAGGASGATAASPTGLGSGAGIAGMLSGPVGGPIPEGNQIAVKVSEQMATVVWIVGAHGAISRYSTTGWIPQSSGVTTDLTRGSAPSMTTCWVVGRAGTILRTVDGEHWTKVIAPITDDLGDVVASSASAATIFAAGGRRFATTDGGATWHPLQ